MTMAKFTKYMTVEDTQIMFGLRTPFIAVCPEGSDAIDFNVMLARELKKASHIEREHMCREDRLYRDLVRS
jgi:hypothetical protein